MFVYGVTTVGATVHLHFCMDRFVGWDFSNSEDAKCKKCGMKETSTQKGCCKDELKQLKIDTDHQKSTVAAFVSLIQNPVINYSPFIYEIVLVDLNNKSDNLYFPPPLNYPVQNRTVMYCTFRI